MHANYFQSHVRLNTARIYARITTGEVIAALVLHDVWMSNFCRTCALVAHKSPWSWRLIRILPRFHIPKFTLAYSSRVLGREHRGEPLQCWAELIRLLFSKMYDLLYPTHVSVGVSVVGREGEHVCLQWQFTTDIDSGVRKRDLWTRFPSKNGDEWTGTVANVSSIWARCSSVCCSSSDTPSWCACRILSQTCRSVLRAGSLAGAPCTPAARIPTNCSRPPCRSSPRRPANTRTPGRYTTPWFALGIHRGALTPAKEIPGGPWCAVAGGGTTFMGPPAGDADARMLGTMASTPGWNFWSIGSEPPWVKIECPLHPCKN